MAAPTAPGETVTDQVLKQGDFFYFHNKKNAEKWKKSGLCAGSSSVLERVDLAVCKWPACD
jgi:hypothetical protein